MSARLDSSLPDNFPRSWLPEPEELKDERFLALLDEPRFDDADFWIKSGERGAALLLNKSERLFNPKKRERIARVIGSMGEAAMRPIAACLSEVNPRNREITALLALYWMKVGTRFRGILVREIKRRLLGTDEEIKKAACRAVSCFDDKTRRVLMRTAVRHDERYAEGGLAFAAAMFFHWRCLTLGKAARMARLSRFDIEEKLAELGLPISNLELEDVLEDLEKLKGLPDS